MAVDQAEEEDRFGVSEELNIALARDRMSSGEARERDKELGGSKGLERMLESDHSGAWIGQEA